MARPHRLSLKEIESRFRAYMDECDKSGRLPIISGLALALGVDISTIWRWSKSKSPGYASIAHRMKAEIATHYEPLLHTLKNTRGVEFWFRNALGWNADREPRETKTKVEGGGGDLKVTITQKEIPGGDIDV